MIQIYTGNGKGKTTAALGLALRAAGAGLKVYIGQFLKKGCYNEIGSLKKIKSIKLEQFGRACFIYNKPTGIDKDLAENGLKKIKKALASKKYKVVILDEINVALSLGLLNLKDVIALIRNAPKKLELVLTGRDCPQQILKLADLISEIKDTKHYYKKGTKARRGIEY